MLMCTITLDLICTKCAIHATVSFCSNRTRETANALNVREDNFFPKAETPVITPQNAAQLNQAVIELIEVSAETAEKDKK